MRNKIRRNPAKFYKYKNYREEQEYWRIFGEVFAGDVPLFEKITKKSFWKVASTWNSLHLAIPFIRVPPADFLDVIKRRIENVLEYVASRYNLTEIAQKKDKKCQELLFFLEENCINLYKETKTKIENIISQATVLRTQEGDFYWSESLPVKHPTALVEMKSSELEELLIAVQEKNALSYHQAEKVLYLEKKLGLDWKEISGKETNYLSLKKKLLLEPEETKEILQWFGWNGS